MNTLNHSTYEHFKRAHVPVRELRCSKDVTTYCNNFKPPKLLGGPWPMVWGVGWVLASVSSSGEHLSLTFRCRSSQTRTEELAGSEPPALAGLLSAAPFTSELAGLRGGPRLSVWCVWRESMQC